TNGDMITPFLEDLQQATIISLSTIDIEIRRR
ncbi:MAG: hypothetical protein ACI819_002755, partial [Neolewinella sp.]